MNTTPDAPIDFLDLIRDLEEVVQMQIANEEDADDVIVISLDVADTEFVLIHAQVVDPSAFTIFCRLGQLPDKPDPVMRRALEINLLTASTRGGILGIDPHTGDLCLSSRVELIETDAQNLLALINAMKVRADAWRSDHFLDATAKPMDLRSEARLVVERSA